MVEDSLATPSLAQGRKVAVVYDGNDERDGGLFGKLAQNTADSFGEGSVAISAGT